MKLISIRDEKCPVSTSTAYKYQKTYPALVFKVAGKVMFDMDEWEKIAEQARDDNVKNAAKNG